MKAYRVYLVGSQEGYLISQKQKPEFERIMSEGGNSVVKIGEVTFRGKEIKRIVNVDVDLESCPEYFKKVIEKEKEKEPAIPGYRKLPTEWIIVNQKGYVLGESVSEKEVERISKGLINMGDVEKNSRLRFIVAKCHYLFDGEKKQYYTELNQIPEALKCIPDQETPSKCLIRQIYRYGERQLMDRISD